MRVWWRACLGAVGALVGLLWTTSLVTNTGARIWSWTPYYDGVYDISLEEMQAAGAPTYPPMGRVCTYLTYAGTRDVFRVERDDYSLLVSEVESGGDVDEWVRRATIVQVEDDSMVCPTLHNFRARALT
jgi:hypothetical protein